MSNLWVYGDSFSHHHDDGASWSALVANTLVMTLRNEAVPGGSDETAIKRFYRNLSRYRPNDVIIFQTSSHGRLHLEFQVNRPETAAVYQHEVDTSQPEHEWYKDNRKHIEWLLVNQDRQMALINQEAYVAVLRNFAEMNPHMTVLVLQNQEQMLTFPMKEPSNFLRSPVSLFKVSQNEYQTKMAYFDWIKYTKYDPRNNHLTEINGNILGSIVAEMITNKQVDLLWYDRFKQNILPVIKTKEDYTKLIEDGLLCPRPRIQGFLK